MAYRIHRLNDGEPIVSAALFDAAGLPDDGWNLNGPSPIALPDWLPPDRRASPDARYYLYFAHHGGRYIRMAWARDVEGPYRLFNVDRRSGPSPGRGVFDLELGESPGALRFDNGVEVHDHVASPDVHLDHENRRFVMYFHGPTNSTAPVVPGETGGQKSLVATSASGLNFNTPDRGGEASHGPRPALLGNAYFRVFEHGGRLYAFSNGGRVWGAPVDAPWAPADPPTADAWERGPNPLADAVAAQGDRPEVDPRHMAVRFLDDRRLEVFFTGRGDAPEVVERVEIDLGVGDWHDWRVTGPPERVLTVERPWEGVDLPIEPSASGAAYAPAHHLRDPGLLEVGDAAFLFYCGAGEQAIGVARLG